MEKFDNAPSWIEQLAGTFQQFGFYGFAAAALVALVYFYKDPWLRGIFAALFVAGAVFSVVVTVYKKPSLRMIAGTFGAFPPDAEISASSTDQNFYIAHRFDSSSVKVFWLYLVPDSPPIGGGGLSFSFYEKKRRAVLSNDLKPTFEVAQIGGDFDMPAAILKPVDGKPVPYFPWTPLQQEEQGTKKICFEGAGLAEKICGRPVKSTASLDRPARDGTSREGVRHGALDLPGWLFDMVLPSAAAQSWPVQLAALPIEDSLKSSDARRWGEAAKEIAKAPAQNAALINDTMAQPVQTNTYTARLAIVTALRDYYRERNLVYADSTTFTWLNDTSWRRIVLDSFDRSDPLGDISRRLLRVSKSTQAKAVLDGTVTQLKTLPGGQGIGACLDLLQQDIYVNWAMLSLPNLKSSSQVTPARINELASLLDPIGFADGAPLATAWRLRANYVMGSVILEAAEALPAADQAAYRSLGIAQLGKVKTAIDALGIQPLRSVYPINTAELDKTVAFFAYMAANGNKTNLALLREAVGGALNPYPSCKL